MHADSMRVASSHLTFSKEANERISQNVKPGDQEMEKKKIAGSELRWNNRKHNLKAF